MYIYIYICNLANITILCTQTINLYVFVDIIIVSEPQDTTVCLNAVAEMDCGFSGANPGHVFPEWRIIYRNDTGSVISNFTVDSEDIIHRPMNGLQWSPDLTSGGNNAPNSKLLVGPVNRIHNWSSYQCVFDTGLIDPSISEVGKITVVGKTTCYY